MSGSRLRYVLSMMLVALSLWAIGHFAQVYASRRLWLGLMATVALLLLLVVGALSFALARRRLLRELLALSADTPAPDTLIGRRQAGLLALQKRGGRPDVTVLEKQAASELAGRAYLGRYFVTVAVLVGLLGTFAGLMETLGGVATLLRDEARSLQSVLPLLGAPLAGLEVTFGASMAGILVTVTLALFQGDLVLADDHVLAELEDHTLHVLIPRLWPAADEPAAKLLVELSALRGDVQQVTESALTVQRAGREEIEQLLLRAGERLNDFLGETGARLSSYAEATAAVLQRQGAEAAQLMDSRLRQSSEAISAHARRMAAEVEGLIGRLGALEEERRRERDAAHGALVERLGTEVSALTARLGTEVSGLTARLSQDQQALIDRLGTEVGGLSERMWAEQRALVEQVTGSVSGLAERLLAEQRATADSAQRSASQFVDRLAGSVSGQIGGLVEATRDGAQRLSQRLEETAQAGATAVKEAAAQGATLLEEAVWKSGAAGAQMADRTERTLRGTIEQLSGYATALQQAEQERTRALLEGERRRAADHAALREQLSALLTEGIGRPVQEHLSAWQESAAQAREAARGIADVAEGLSRSVGEFGRSAAALVPPLSTLAPELHALSAEVALLCARADEGREPLPPQLLQEVIRLTDGLERLERRLSAWGGGAGAAAHQAPAG